MIRWSLVVGGASLLGIGDLLAQQASMETRSVLVDGVSIRVAALSLDGRTPGQPAVILESGGGVGLETWTPILSRVAEFAPVLAYDRSGTGQSEWDGQAPTPERVGSRLRNLLEVVGVTPPYVLVGHSWGAALVRYFAGLHPDGVVGVLYLDPTDITQSPDDELAVFASLGAGATERAAFYAVQERAMAAAPAPLRAEAEVVMELMRLGVDRRRLPEPPEVPTSVVAAGRPTVLPPGVLPVDPEAYARLTLESRIVRLRGWVREPGTFVLLPNSGHFVHTEDPDTVVRAIRQLVDGQRQ